MESLTGKQFHSYRIEKPLGEGGMATVYRAYQPSMDRYVALKILPKLYAEDPSFLRRFKQEARLIAQLQHPNILPVYDYGEAEGYTYLVMSYVEGGSLAEAIKGKRMDFTWICRVIQQVASALDYAHSKGIIHRDVKPGNILLDEGGNCLLTDFGLAKVLSGSPQFTASGTFLGTPTYASPQQCLGLEVDHRTDIYSLGVMLYEMTTGRPPFIADTPMAVVIKHVHEPLPLPRQMNPDIPENVERVILKALDKEPENRFDTATQMAEALVSAVRSAGYAVPSAVLLAAPEQALPTQAIPAPTILPTPEKATQPKASPRMPASIWILASFVCLLSFFGMLFVGYRVIQNNINKRVTQPPQAQATLPAATSLLQDTPRVSLPPTESLSQVAPADTSPPPTNDQGQAISAEVEMERSPYAMAVAADGTIHVVWAGQIPDQPCLRHAFSDDGGKSFSKPEEIISQPGFTCANPALVITADGRQHIVWMMKGNDERWSVYYASSSETDTTDYFPVSAMASNQVNPALAANPVGEVFIAWQDNRLGNWRIYLTHLSAGGTIASQKVVFAPELPAAPADQGTQKQVALAAGRSGIVHLVWIDDREKNWQIFYTQMVKEQFEPARVAAGGLVEDLGDYFPSLLVNPDGRLHIAWGNAYIIYPANNKPIYLPAYALSPDEKGVFAPAVQVGEGTLYASIRAEETSIAAIPGKAAYVAFTMYNQRVGEKGGSFVWVYSQPNGETNFKPGVAVAHATGGDVYHYPSLAADAEGVLHIAWAYRRGSEWDVFYSQSTDGGGTFASPLQVNQP